MSWYYAKDGKQVGPVDDREWQRLTGSGIIQPDTMVWKNGLPDWIPYASVDPGAQGSAPAVPRAPRSESGDIKCDRCGLDFPASELVSIGGHRVCAACKPAAVQKLTEGTLAPKDNVYAGFWIRVGAKIIDGIILGVVGQLVQFVVGMAVTGASQDAALGLALGQMGLSFLISGAYSVGFLGRFGATPGKMACGLRVVRSDGKPISYARATGRFFAEILSSIIFGIGYLMVAFDDEKRALHDRICDTRVLRK